MISIRRVFTWGATGALVLQLGSGAQAQLTSAEQKCIDGYNNKLRLVGQQAGKDYRSCVKGAGKGDVADADLCVTNDTPGKIAGKEQKVTDLYPAKCNGTEPIQQGSTAGNTAMVHWSQDLIREIFGNPISGVAAPLKEIAKCQDKAYQRAEQLFTEKLKAFRSCKKDGMKAGAVVDSATLAAVCASDPQPFAIPDPQGKQDGKAQKLVDDVNGNCGPPVGPPYASIFPGDCSGSTSSNDLGQCIERLVECKVCRALNAADGMHVNCDLFDDGIANASCGIDILLHKCVLDTSPTTDSQLSIHLAALPVPLTFGLSGALDIGASGNVASCDIQFINPVVIPSIGTFCLTPAPSCAPGVRWSGPGAGPPLGVDVQSDGNAGACISNAMCATQAAAACLTFGPGYTPLSAACTGYCSGGDQSACTTDAQCQVPPKAGNCNGPDPVGITTANICQISCVATAVHGPSPAGAIQCNLGAHLRYETAAPCDGTDVIFDGGNVCLPMSTQEASSKITDANFIGGFTVPALPDVNDQLGVSIPAAGMDTSVLTGLRGVGAFNLYGTSFQDIAVGIKATCQ